MGLGKVVQQAFLVHADVSIHEDGMEQVLGKIPDKSSARSC
jgi:hypothetical protein